MDITNAALIAIDMQKAFDDAPWPPRWNSDVDRKGLLLLDRWRSRKLPIFHVRHDSTEPNSTLRPDTPGNALRDGFHPLEGETLIVKTVNAAFIGTDLNDRLRSLGIRTLVAFGISTDMCVSTTVRVGANLGYRMIVVEDACDCFELPGRDGCVIPAKTVHDVHMATLGFEFASVTTTADLLAVEAKAQPLSRDIAARTQQ